MHDDLVLQFGLALALREIIAPVAARVKRLEVLTLDWFGLIWVEWMEVSGMEKDL